MPKRSKKDKQDAGTGVFANSPFKALKGMQKTAAGAAPPRAEGPKPLPSSEAGDDDALFLRAVDGARPVRADDEEREAPSAPMRSPAASPHSTSDEQDGRELFLQAMGRLGAAGAREDDLAEDGADEGPARSQSGRMRQLKRGTIRIGEELDLHGFLKDEALRRLGHFITSARARGLAAVLVITGKGLNSPEGPVLPGAVADWLREQGTGLVAEFHPAPRDRGGSGATVVFLKPPGR